MAKSKDLSELSLPSLPKGTRQARAIVLRDRIVPLVLARGQAEDGVFAGCVQWRVAGWSFGFKTPFARPGQRPQARSYEEALLLQKPRKDLPYWLDVWRGPKVMSVRWDLDGDFAMISFRPGDWEEDLGRFLDAQATRQSRGHAAAPNHALGTSPVVG